MDNHIYRLLSIGIGVFFCIGALSLALRQEQVSMTYLMSARSSAHQQSIVQENGLETLNLVIGYEIIAELGHAFRRQDVQVDNSDYFFYENKIESVEYTLDGVVIDHWNELNRVDINGVYDKCYHISSKGEIVGVDYQVR